MRMRCISRSIFRGDVVKAGAVLDISDAEAGTDMVKANFEPVDGEERPSGGGDVVVVAGLTRRQAIDRLREVKEKVPANISDARLRERFEEVFGAGFGA